MKKIFAAIALSIALVAKAATPTFAQINEAINTGQIQEARVMMDVVLKKRPESVRAHLINARLLGEENASLEEIKKELELAHNLGNGVEYTPTKEVKQDGVRKIVLTLLSVCGIITAVLVWQLTRLQKRKSNQKEKI
jgi:hypothetical protein